MEVVHTCDSSTQRAKVEELWVQGQPELHRSSKPDWAVYWEPASKKQNKTKDKMKNWFRSSLFSFHAPSSQNLNHVTTPNYKNKTRKSSP
jgi:hypothetical protein